MEEESTIATLIKRFRTAPASNVREPLSKDKFWWLEKEGEEKVVEEKVLPIQYDNNIMPKHDDNMDKETGNYQEIVKTTEHEKEVEESIEDSKGCTIEYVQTKETIQILDKGDVINEMESMMTDPKYSSTAEEMKALLLNLDDDDEKEEEIERW